MKITLFLSTGLYDFSLPNDVSGSYSFDSDPDESAKLINVEAVDGRWVIYSTSDVKIILNDRIGDRVYLVENCFYILQRGEVNYLIYTEVPAHGTMVAYNYDQNINLIIGNSEQCNLKYNCSLLNNTAIRVSYTDKGLIVQKDGNVFVYLNNIFLKENSHSIRSGDQIDIYGLRIIFLPGFLLVNNPGNLLTVLKTSNLTDKIINFDDSQTEREIKDVPLYGPNDYFSKPPRIRRVIEEKEIKIDRPPSTVQQTTPLIMTLGPMLAMGVSSSINFLNQVDKINSSTEITKQQLLTLITTITMLFSSLVWPIFMQFYNRIHAKIQKKTTVKKYKKYFETKKKELQAEYDLQKNILQENLLSIKDCVNIINTKTINFWDKRIEQSDFLVVRLGIGDVPLKINYKFPEEEFSMEEDELKKIADEEVNKFKYIKDVPVGYSLFENNLTAVMGENKITHDFLNNIILQLLTFYSYEDLKLIVFTNKINEKRWNYVKLLNHNFDNSKRLRFFSSSLEDAKEISGFIEFELNNRLQDPQAASRKPYYLIITDDYDSIKKFNFMKCLTELDNNVGFSIVIAEERMSKVPSKCVNFITLGNEKSSVLQNSYEKQETTEFKNEIDTSIDMNSVARVLSNIPIEFEEGMSQLPESVTFLEMEKVSKIEQLNIMNRWNTNDSTTSLKAEIGVDENEELIYLDLHEKKHGPHGLIAGTTGSGKSEFIITYILSMTINYSPDDVAFILIDYKGGGLAFAFENQATGVSLPHLAGIITNLDKAEMNRTLVSIDSEVKRRQRIFNEARDKLGQSTIDIYKYQQFYHEGKLDEPCPHLFIICDEFAELKSQQPDFMDNLISVARIGRSLGVHLILATQKPSGVVNDQIWSNTKFRVCLKVQTEGDSNEMIKKPLAASLKQAGRFYLQVGLDEVFLLGQSGWCGAKYYPTDKIVKTVDKSINFIGNTGSFIKSIQAGDGSQQRGEAQGEQLGNILNNIIEVSKACNKKAKRLWLENIPALIYINNLITKYSYQIKPYEVCPIIGEYDAPENQEQGLLSYSLNERGNTIIIGNEGTERENLLDAFIFSIITTHSPDEVNLYLVDYGSEVLRKYMKAPHFGGMCFADEVEPLRNLFKLIDSEIAERKQLFMDYGGEYNSYIKQQQQRIPMRVIIINNMDSFNESNSQYSDMLISITRDCARYGIYFILTGSTPSSIYRKILQNFETNFVLHLTDASSYNSLFTNQRSKLIPRDIPGRGLCEIDGAIHEFQTASIVEEEKLSQTIKATIEELNNKYQTRAKPIPSLPEQVTFDFIKPYIKDIKHVPIGISRETLDPVKFDLTVGNMFQFASNRLENMRSFILSLVKVFQAIDKTSVVFIDAEGLFPQFKGNIPNYFDSDFQNSITKICEYVKYFKTQNADGNAIVIFAGLEKLKKSVTDTSVFDNLFKEIKSSENVFLFVAEALRKFKLLDYDNWYSQIKNNIYGLWIGTGVTDQSMFRLGSTTKDMSKPTPNNMGYYISESNATFVKLIEFEKIVEENEDE